MSELKKCPSPVENAITVLKNEKQCVLRQIQIGGCDRNCVKCDLVMKDSEILAGYDTAVAVLRLAQPDHSGDATEMPANDPLTHCRDCTKAEPFQGNYICSEYGGIWGENDGCTHGERQPERSENDG